MDYGRTLKEIEDFILYKAGYLLDEETEHRFIKYLEKQKEQKPGTTEDNPIDPFDTKLFQDGVKEGRRLEREDMQKPAEWSEEDEKMRQHIISDLREFRDCETDEELISDYEDEIAWLKSLRPQPHWKPSEEQMMILRWAANGMVDESIAAPEMRAVLRELYNDLKKL